MVRLHIDIAQDGYGPANAEGVKGLIARQFGYALTGKAVCNLPAPFILVYDSLQG